MDFGFAYEISTNNNDKINSLVRFSKKAKLFFKTREYGIGIQKYIIGIICVDPGFDFFFKESKKYTKSKKMLEYDIKLNHVQFENATEKEIEEMVASALLNSLNVVQELKINNFDISRFRKDLIILFEQNGIEWNINNNKGLMNQSSEPLNQKSVVNDKYDLIYDIKLNIYGFKQLEEAHFAKEFFQILQNANVAYLPDKIGVDEPLNTSFSMEEAQNMWAKSEILKGFSNSIKFRSRMCRGLIIWRHDDLNFIDLTISNKLLCSKDEVEKFIELAKRLFFWLNGIYGYSCLGIDLLSGIQVFNFKECLGGISWMTLFGPPYVEMFGKEIIQTTPCKVDEFAENCFIVLTSDEPAEIDLEIQERIKKHLGEDAFCRKEHPGKEDLIAGEDKNRTKGYRSPDLSLYMKNS